MSDVKKGKVWAIATGPGSSDLITVRAARQLGELDVLYAPAGRKGGDSLALSIVREFLSPTLDIKERHFPMSADQGEKAPHGTPLRRRCKRTQSKGFRSVLLRWVTPCCSAHGCFCWNAYAGTWISKLYPA